MLDPVSVGSAGAMTELSENANSHNGLLSHLVTDISKDLSSLVAWPVAHVSLCVTCREWRILCKCNEEIRRL